MGGLALYILDIRILVSAHHSVERDGKYFLSSCPLLNCRERRGCSSNSLLLPDGKGNNPTNYIS